MSRTLLTRGETPTDRADELARLLSDAAVTAIESGEEAINQRTLLLAPYTGPSRSMPLCVK